MMPHSDPDWSSYEPASAPTPIPEGASLDQDKYTRLLERCVGEQISRVATFGDQTTNNPWGGATIGFEFREHARAVFWVRPIPAELQPIFGVCAGWVPAWFPPQTIITPRMERAMRSDRPQPDLEVLPKLIRYVEGEVIQGVTVPDTANRYGGQSLRFELTADLILLFHAAPGSAHGARRIDGTTSRFTANLAIELDRPHRLTSLAAPIVWTPD